MKTCTALVIVALLTLLSGCESSRESGYHWKKIKEYDEYIHDPANNKRDVHGFGYVENPPDIMPSLYALENMREVEHLFLIFPTVPQSREVIKFWTESVSDDPDIIYALGPSVGSAYKVKGVQPFYMNLWFKPSAANRVKELVTKIDEFGEDGETEKSSENGLALIQAAAKGDMAAVKKALDGGADVNTANADGTTPLFIASAEGNDKIVQLLLDSGAKVDAANTSGMTPLWVASQNERWGTIKLLLKAGADPDIGGPNGITPLLHAASRGETEAVRVLLEAGADADITVKMRGKEYTPLSIAEERGHADTVKLLKDHASKAE